MARVPDEQDVAAMPLSKQALKALFDELGRPNPDPCTHTFKETVEFLVREGQDPSTILPWLQEYGARCDCEVIFNVAEVWEDLVGWVPIIDDEDEDSAEYLADADEPAESPRPWWKFW